MGEGTGLTFSDSILARFLFCSFRGEDRGPRLVAYLEEVVHPLPTGEEVAIGLRAVFVPAESVPPSSSGVAVVTGCVPKPMESPGCVHEGVLLSPSFSGGEIGILTAVLGIYNTLK